MVKELIDKPISEILDILAYERYNKRFHFLEISEKQIVFKLFDIRYSIIRI